MLLATDLLDEYDSGILRWVVAGPEGAGWLHVQLGVSTVGRTLLGRIECRYHVERLGLILLGGFFSSNHHSGQYGPT